MAVVAGARLSLRSPYQRQLNVDPPYRYIGDPFFSVENPLCLDLQLEEFSFICPTIERNVNDTSFPAPLQLEGQSFRFFVHCLRCYRTGADVWSS